MKQGWITLALGLGLVQTAVGGTVVLQWDKLNVAGDYDSRPITQSVYADPQDFSATQVRLLHYYGEWKRARQSSKDAKKRIAELRQAHRTLRMNHDVLQLDPESDWSISLSQNIAEQAKWRGKTETLAQWEANHPVRLTYETRQGRNVLIAAQWGQALARR